MDFPRVTEFLETLRTKYVTKAIAQGNPLFLDTFQQDAIHDLPPKYTYSPLQHLLTIFSHSLADNDLLQPDLAIYRPNYLSPHVYPSQH